MKRNFKLLVSIQMGILMTMATLPAQAAVNIGAPRTLTGSVITLHNSGTVTTPVVSVPSTTQVPTTTPDQGNSTVVTSPSAPNSPSSGSSSPVINIGPMPTTNGGNVISLKNILNQSSSIPGSVTPAPAQVPVPVQSPTPDPSPAPAPSPAQPVIPAVSALTADEQLMVDMINQERLAAGLNPVTVDLRLAAVGRAKANDLKANNYFDHNSPTYGSPWAMMQEVGLTVKWAGENISGNKSVAGSMASLMQSPGHRANILNPRFTHVGIGIAYGSAYGNLYVQEFLQE